MTTQSRQRDGSFENPQHIVWLRNKKINILLKVYLVVIYFATSPNLIAAIFYSFCLLCP